MKVSTQPCGCMTTEVDGEQPVLQRCEWHERRRLKRMRWRHRRMVAREALETLERVAEKGEA